VKVLEIMTPWNWRGAEFVSGITIQYETGTADLQGSRNARGGPWLQGLGWWSIARLLGHRLCLPEVAGVATMIQGAPMKNFVRITVDPAQMGGVPCVRHLRIPVATVLRLLAGGLTEVEILSEYPDLQAEDIRECLRFAAASAMEREMPLPYSA
jgi:uncharacterized protein (DUF433 family)